MEARAGRTPARRGREGRTAARMEVIRDFKDTVHPLIGFFEFFSCLAMLRIEGCLNSTL